MPLYINYLPYRPKPKLNESLPGYLIRLAESIGVPSPYTLLPEIFHNFNDPNFAMDIRGPWKNGELFNAPMKKLGLGFLMEELLPCTFYNFYMNIDNSNIKFANQPEEIKNDLLISESILNSKKIKICPSCINEFGYINKYWSFEWVKGCHIHGAKLLTECPNCEKPLTNKNFFSLKICTHCKIKYSVYHPNNIEYEYLNGSCYGIKGNYFLSKTLDSIGIDLPYLFNDGKERPYSSAFWELYIQFLGTVPNFDSFFKNTLYYMASLNVILKLFKIFNEYQIEELFGLKVHDDDLENKEFFSGVTMD